MRFPCFLALLAGVFAARADFHVAPAGSDSNPGSRARPFATLERARDAVRELKAAGKLPKGEFTVWLHAGDFRRTNAFELSAADSGRDAAPIVWRAWKDDRVRLIGGAALPPVGRWTPVSDAAVAMRFDAAARVHVRQLDLRALGITEIGEMKSRGFSRGSAPAHCELFFDGRPMTLARWPNEGQFDKLAGFPSGSGKNDDHGGNIGDLPSGFLYAGDRPNRWQDTSDLWVHGYWAWDWANSYERVAELDRERRFIRTAPPHGLYGFRKGQRFYYLNVLEELDLPGEWFLDRTGGKLYFWPPDNRVGRDSVEPTFERSEASNASISPAPSQQDARSTRAGVAGKQGSTEPSPTELTLSLLDQPLLRLTDASHVQFRGLLLEATRGNGVEIRGGTNNRIAGCVLRNLGNSGVVIEGGFGHGVVSCDLFDTGDGGVSLNGGDRQTLQPGGHFVDNCHFRHQGRWSKCYVPAIALTGVGLRASHNLIHDHPHCAILFWGNDHLMEFNDIHHIALETGDVGAIYTGRDYSFRGNRIRHNYIHETGGVGMGSMGVYMDDCVSGTEVFGNVFYKVHWAMFIGGGRDHRVENNLFVDCDPAVRADARGLDTSPVWRGMVDDFMRKQLAAVPAALYRDRYPAIKSLDAFYDAKDGFNGIPAEGNVIIRNVCVGKWLELGWHAQDKGFEVRDNFTSGDPLLVNPAKQDFRLKPESPAFKTGFQALPIGQIGLRQDADRKHLAKLQ